MKRVTITLSYIVKTEEKQRSARDRRRRVTRVTASYRDAGGIEYRRCFESATDVPQPSVELFSDERTT